MADAAGTDEKPRTKTPRARKAPSNTAGTNAAAKTVRRPRAPKTATQKVSASVAAAGKGVSDTASHAVDAIKGTAEKAVAASLVTEAAKAVTSRARKVTARKPGSKTAARPAAKRSAASHKSSGVGTILGVAAAGLAAGIAVNLGRKAAVQAPSVMAGDWFEALKAEHKMALGLLDKLARSTPEQPAKRSLLLVQLKHALGKHAFTEENAIYPALRDWGDKADADALNHEHGYVKQYLYDLEKMGKSDPGFGAKIADFRADLEKHIREEEDKIFPPFHKGLSEEQNKALTAMANKEGFKLA